MSETDLTPGVCPVQEARSIVFDRREEVRQPDAAFRPLRLPLLSQALRLLTEITHGRGTTAHVEHLEENARVLAESGLEAATAVLGLIENHRDAWRDHIENRHCVEGSCFHRPVATCHAACPAHVDIPNFLTLVGQGRHREAIALMRMDNPLPFVSGFVCPEPCNIGCGRATTDEPLAVRHLHSVAAQHALDAGGYPRPDIAPSTGRSVGIVGAGPAGLSAAYYLALAGHAVVIYESHDQPGGTLTYGIPAFRLPREVIAADVDGILELGAQLKTGQALGRDFTLTDLRERHDAVFLGLGAQVCAPMRIEGEKDFPQVVGALTFLARIASGDRTKPADRVIVVGGGNAAMDAARTCVRLGCHVTVAYRRTAAEMPAFEEEVDETVDEGIDFRFLTIPLEVIGEDGRLKGLRCLKAELGPPDGSGRQRPVPIEGSEFAIEAGAIITAIGQRPETGLLGEHEEPALFDWSIQADTKTGRTTHDWLFAGGDAVSGPATVVEAIGAGKNAAHGIDAWLSGKSVADLDPGPVRRDDVPPLETPAGVRTGLVRPHATLRDPAERARDFVQVEMQLPDAVAFDEAKRCLRCDVCEGCGLCHLACEEIGIGALHLEATIQGRASCVDFTKAADKCIGCGTCASVCPTGAIQMVDEGDRRRLVLTGTVIQELPLEPCEGCGRPWFAPAYLAWIETRQVQVPGAQLGGRTCPDCAASRRTSRARPAGRSVVPFPPPRKA